MFCVLVNNTSDILMCAKVLQYISGPDTSPKMVKSDQTKFGVNKGQMQMSAGSTSGWPASNTGRAGLFGADISDKGRLSGK